MGLGLQGLGFGVKGLGSRVWGWGFGVQGLGRQQSGVPQSNRPPAASIGMSSRQCQMKVNLQELPMNRESRCMILQTHLDLPHTHVKKGHYRWYLGGPLRAFQRSASQGPANIMILTSTYPKDPSTQQLGAWDCGSKMCGDSSLAGLWLSQFQAHSPKLGIPTIKPSSPTGSGGLSAWVD